MHLPPKLALLLTLGFVVFLFRRDFREKPAVTGALWLPLLWMLIICSRPITYWLRLFGFLQMQGPVSVEEGSTLDAWFYFALIATGIFVLNKRKVGLAELTRNNAWLIAFLLYCFVAVFWSDFPVVAFKRWIKILGHPIMALIVFTEPDPEQALRTLMKRAAYIIVPISIMLIKYYPAIGRAAGPWAIAQTSNGIAPGKNALGVDCLLLGFFFFWYLLNVWQAERSKNRRDELLLTGGFLIMIWWLLFKAHSSTALGSVIIGMLTVVLLQLRFVNKKVLGWYVLAAIVVAVVAEAVFGVSSIVIRSLGRDPTLTGRTELWRELLTFDINPIFGVGFESFWLGERLERLWDEHWWHPTEAHNGYLEIYLALGLIGMLMLGALFIATFRKIRLELLRNFEWGRFRLGFFTAIVFYNWTESSFKSLHPLWLVFYIISLDYPKLESELAEESSEPPVVEEEMELVYSPNRIANS